MHEGGISCRKGDSIKVVPGAKFDMFPPRSSSATRLGAGDLAFSARDLRSRSLKTTIADLIREAILTGRYPLGSQLSEKSLSSELQVSRTPVREALMILQSEGLVDVRPQNGTFVFSTSREEVTAVCEMRLVLESAALCLGIKRHRAVVVENLEHVVAEAGGQLEDDLKSVHRLDTQFHRALIEGSENSFLIDAYRTITDRLQALKQLLPINKHRLSHALAQHREVIDAVRRGNERLGEKLLRDHIHRVEVMLLSRLPDFPGTANRRKATAGSLTKPATAKRVRRRLSK